MRDKGSLDPCGGGVVGREREREKEAEGFEDHLEGLCPRLANGWDGKGEGT